MGKPARRHLRPVPAATAPSAEPLAWVCARALRPHQWSKNLLLFVPLLMAKREGEWALEAQAALAFGAFCLTASAVYLANDLIDREADRKHPEKKHRPFASGRLPASYGYCGVPLLLAGAFGLGSFLPPVFLAILVGYLVTNALYSGWLKRAPMLDVVVLAGFYSLRLFAGASAVGVPISEWLLVFSQFLFFSLALAKRVSELHLIGERHQGRTPGRGYRAADIAQLSIFGGASGYLAVLVYALFINSPHVQAFYERPWALWGLFPLLLYWISRIWLVANRGELDSDPLVFTLRDRPSQVLVVCAALILLMARGTFF